MRAVAAALDAAPTAASTTDSNERAERAVGGRTAEKGEEAQRGRVAQRARGSEEAQWLVHVSRGQRIQASAMGNNDDRARAR